MQPAPAQRPENLRHLHTSFLDGYWKSVDQLVKMWAFYLAITAAVVGYVLTQNLPAPLPGMLLLGACFLSVLTIVAYAAWAWGLYKTVQIIERIVVQIDPPLFKELRLEPLYSTWRRLLAFLAAFTIFAGAMIVYGLLRAFGQLGS